MKTKHLAEVLARVEVWPPDAQKELAEIALEIEAGPSGAEFEPKLDELAAIDRGIRAADKGRLASDSEVEAVFAKLRRG